MMRQKKMKTIQWLLLLCLLCSAVIAQSTYFPPTDRSGWETLDPDSLNFCRENIDDLYDYLESEDSRSFLLLKDGRIVLEKYFFDFNADSSWVWFSAGKSLMSTLVGIAQSEGILNISDKTSDYLGDGWTSMPQEQEDSIKVVHQLTMTTGLDDEDFACTNDTCLFYFAPAGSRWVYHNAPYTLLRNVLESASGLGLNFYTNSRLENRIGMQGIWIPIGFNNFYFSTARDMARFGLLVQNRGEWDGTTVVGDTAYMRQMVETSQAMNPSYGYLWWLNGKDSVIPPGDTQSYPGPIAPNAPQDLYTAAGAQGQFISVSPSTGYIMIRQGLNSSSSLAALNFHDQIWQRIMALDCQSTSAYAVPSPNIRLYPNPAVDVLYITAEDDKHDLEAVRIYDVHGQLMPGIQNPNGTSSGISLAHLPSGVYTVVLQTENAHLSNRFVIQR